MNRQMQKRTLRQAAAAWLMALLTAVATADPVIVEDDAFPPPDPTREELGRLLFFDKILSGNRDTACATCHNPLMAGADGASLTLGAGGRGAGPMRQRPTGGFEISHLLPRHTLALFNVGAREFDTLFHDGRLAAVDDGFFNNDGVPLPNGLDTILAAQVLLNVLSIQEMTGAIGSNSIVDAVIDGQPEQAWDLLAERLREIPEYVERFGAAFADIEQPDDITLVHAANAIAAFEATAFRCTSTPFDRALHGDVDALSPLAWRGAELFFNGLGCADCHSGPLLTDHRFHALAVPQIGPGRGDNQPGYFDGLDDFGREQVTRDPADRFRFRTPGLRQIALTGPWGHSGAFASLEAMVRHHLDPVASLENYDPSRARFPAGTLEPERDLAVQNDPQRRAAIAATAELPARAIDEVAFHALMTFLRDGLTDHQCMERLHGLIPDRVPSGLPLAD